MATDYALSVRRAIMTEMKATQSLTIMVPSASIYPQVAANPAWPFIRIGSPSSIPIRGDCLDGQDITVAVHAFAKPRALSGATVETAEDYAARIGAEIARVLDGRTLTLAHGVARVRWRGSQLIVDGAEADAFHAIVNFTVRVIG